MNENVRILIVDDEKIALKNLEHVMRKEGYAVVGTQSGQKALKLLAESDFDIVLTDLKMEKVDGMHILKRCRDLHPRTAVIMITGFATLESAVLAMKQGAFNYVAKPFKLEEVRRVVREAVDLVMRRKESQDMAEIVDAQIESDTGRVRIITQDVHLRVVLDTALRIAPTDCNVLIAGPVGAGKELLARFIHSRGHRSGGPFIKVNCGVMDEDSLAREIFGSPVGSGPEPAASVQAGAVARATGGTLYLDEIDRMPASLQLRLLEFMQAGGSGGETDEAKSKSVRIIAAGDCDFQEVVKNGRIRPDLYYRLNVVLLEMPGLSRRREDIPLLAYYFLKKHSALMRKDVQEISREALATLMNYDFPGNTRELESIVERGIAIASGPTIELHDLPESLRTLTAGPARKKEGRIPSLEEQEEAYIKWVLRETGGNRSTAAQILGIDRVSLWRKLKKYGLTEESEREAP